MSEATMVSEDTGVEPYYQVASADAVTWDEEADLVVVGFGGAGAVAAVQGRERGASVIVVDRFDGGGATAYSGGIFYAGGGTPWQQEAGYADTPEQMQRYLEMERVPVGPETLKRFCEQSADNLAWVSGFGVRFDSTLYSGKITYPPEGKFLYFCGNEKIPHFAAQAKPAPRGHRAVGMGMTGRYYYAAMREAALAAGARLIAHAPARRLIVDPTGAVLGIEIDQLPDSALDRHRALYRKVDPYVPMNGARAERAVEQCNAFERNAGAQRLRLRARQGVILATGGFVFNRVQLARYRPDLARTYKALTRLGSLGCNGSGIGLGQSVGGATDLMDKAFVGRSLSPPEGFVKGMLVNGQGQRFVNEDAYLAIVGDAIATQASSTAWLILDRRTFWAGLKTLLTIERKMFLLYALPTLINILLGARAPANLWPSSPASAASTPRRWRRRCAPTTRPPRPRRPMPRASCPTTPPPWRTDACMPSTSRPIMPSAPRPPSLWAGCASKKAPGRCSAQTAPALPGSMRQDAARSACAPTAT